MKNSTKGALAAGTAAVLLLGGAGSLAYWTADQDIEGGTISSGLLELTAPTCGDWDLTVGGTFTPGTTELVPGDEITKVCTLTLTAEGENIGATLTIDDTALTASPLKSVLTSDATFVVNDAAYAPITAAGTYEVEATITVAFPYGGPVSTPDPLTADDNTTQDQSTVLDAISVVAVQTPVA
jgi:alternate signal-mediated exported protein